MRDRYPHLCLVMASISTRREDILLALQAGVNGYIPKNIGLKEFSSALAQILGGMVYVPASITSPSIVDSAEGTVKVHLASLFRTLGVHSRSAAAAKGAVIVWENARSLH